MRNPRTAEPWIARLELDDGSNWRTLGLPAFAHECKRRLSAIARLDRVRATAGPPTVDEASYGWQATAPKLRSRLSTSASAAVGTPREGLSAVALAEVDLPLHSFSTLWPASAPWSSSTSYGWQASDFPSALLLAAAVCRSRGRASPCARAFAWRDERARDDRGLSLPALASTRLIVEAVTLMPEGTAGQRAPHSAQRQRRTVQIFEKSSVHEGLASATTAVHCGSCRSRAGAVGAAGRTFTPARSCRWLPR